MMMVAHSEYCTQEFVKDLAIVQILFDAFD